jgi:hypothetical protein
MAIHSAVPPPLPGIQPGPPPRLEKEDPSETNVRGYQAEPSRRSTVYQLAAAMILASLFSLTPAVLDVAEHFRTIDSPGVSRWVFLLLLASIVQIAYAVYLVQMPDWSTVWVVSLVTLALAMVYAMLVGVLMLSGAQSELVQLLGLEDQLSGNRAAGWCTIMLSLSCLLAYATGQVSVRWYHAYTGGALSRK